MLTADPLINLSARGHDTHRTTREHVVKALLGPGDPWTRQETARHAWEAGRATLARLQEQAVKAARAAVEGHRRDLFDMTRAAAHVTGDTMARQTARETAKQQAAQVADQGEALQIISGSVLRAHRRGSEFGIVKAGAVAERAHDEGWQDAVTAWASSGVGTARGGLARLAALQHAERIASEAETLEGLGDLTPLPEMVARLSGRKWVESA